MINFRKFAGVIRKHLPRRRRRFWRYVSPRRRSIGILALVTLMGIVYGYWYLTNDGRIRRQAKWYLRRLTGTNVNVARAHFSLFGNIELQGVHVFLDDGRSSYPLLHAKTVILRHRPLSLLLARKVQPTEITFIEPTIIVEHFTSDNSYNYQHLIRRMRIGYSTGPRTSPMELPHIRVRDCKLLPVEVMGKLRVPGKLTRWHMSMVPKDRSNYVITIGQASPDKLEPIHASFALNVLTGKFKPLSASAPILAIAGALPEKYRQWRKRFNVKGELRLRAGPDEADKGKPLEFELVNVSLKLPADQGGVDLEHVSGILAFDDKGLLLRNISGRIVQANHARFELSGRYEGYEPTSPLKIQAKIHQLTLPLTLPKPSELAKFVQLLEKWYNPRGTVNILADISRPKGGKLRINATAKPQGMSISYRYFPFRMYDLAGKIILKDKTAKFQNLTCRRGSAKFNINGNISFGPDGKHYDVKIRARDVPCDEHLRNAMSESYQRIWRKVNPAGNVDALIHVHRKTPDDPRNVDVDIISDGSASITYSPIPYRLDNIVGQVHVSGGNVVIDNARARRGNMRCTVNGTIAGIKTRRPDVKIKASIRNLPIDDVFLRALNARNRKLIEDLHATGHVHAEATVTQNKGRNGGKLSYQINAEVNDAEIKPKVFPYLITKGKGKLQINAQRITISEFQGRHGLSKTANIKLTKAGYFARLSPDSDGLAVSLDFKADQLQLDDDLYQAVPKQVREIWRRLSPSGITKGTLSIRKNIVDEKPEKTPSLDYKVVLEPINAQVTYRDFPYTFKGLAGRIIATPGQVILQNLISNQPKRSLLLGGLIAYDDNTINADVSIRAKGLDINPKVLSMMPKVVGPLARRLKPGGSYDVDFPKLTFTRRILSATAPADEKQNYPTIWKVRGTTKRKATLTFHDAIIAMGVGEKKFSGSLAGLAHRDAGGTSISAQVAIDSIVLGKREVTNLQAHIIKSPTGSIIHVKDISARMHGGSLAGFAKLNQDTPLNYGVNLSFERLKLEKLFSSVPAGGKSTATGLLDGNIKLTGLAGKLDSREAWGVINISKARLYKLPVILGLLHVVYLHLPGDSAFSDGQVKYRLNGQRLIFDEISLSGPALSIVGSGTMNMKTSKLNLTFLTGPPGNLPRIAGLDKIFKSIAREMLEIRISGTMDKPKMTTVSLRSLDEAIRKLLQPEGLNR